MINLEQYQRDLRSAPFSELLKIVLDTHTSTDCGQSLCNTYALQELDRREAILNCDYRLREPADR